MSKRQFRVWKGTHEEGKLHDYSIEVDKGMVVLDVVHQIQKLHAYFLQDTLLLQNQ